MLTRTQKIAIGVVVTLIVLAIVGVLVWYFVTHKQSPPGPPGPGPPNQKYNCDPTSGQCVPCLTNCAFDTLDECTKSGCSAPPPPPPSTKFCTTKYPARTPETRKAYWKMVGKDVKMPKTCEDLIGILNEGYLHGSPMYASCITDPKQPPADPRDKMSMTYCNGNQFVIKEPANSGKITGGNQFPSIAPPGMTLTSFDKRDDGVYFKSAECVDTCQSDETCIRGTCTKTTPNQPNTRKNYKLALYHGGIVGKPGFNTKCYINYLQRVADFVVSKNIDIVFVSLQMPILGKMQFPYYLSPDFLAKYFVQPILAKKSNAEFGVLAYVNPKDSSWNFQDHDNQTPSKDDFTKACATAKLSDVLDQGFNCFNNTIAQEMEGGTSGFYDGTSCTDPKTQKAPYCTPNDTSSKTPCPNIPAQVVAYVEHINQAIAKLNLNTSISYIAYDNEDMSGSLAVANNGNCQFQIAVETLLKQKNMSIQVMESSQPAQLGYAYSMDSVSNDNTGVNFVMPEMYWYMNMMGPCMGNNYQIGNNSASFDYSYPQVCTSGTVYRDGVNATKGNMAQWLQYVMQYNENLEPNSNFGKNNFTAMIQNMQANPDKVWAMMSNENLSASDPKALGKVPNCLARSMNSDQIQKGDICGTFDGIAYWSWDQVVEFYNALYDVVWPTSPPKTTPIFGLYESQFIPPSWTDMQDSSNPNLFDQDFNSSCKLTCSDTVPCSTNKDCTDFSNTKCPNASSSNCKDNKGFKSCQFTLPQCVNGDANCYAAQCTNGKPVQCPNGDKTCVVCPKPGHCQASNNNFICCQTI